VPEEQSVHARDGVADPHGCGNPLRSGTAGLATAPDSQPPATSHQPPAIFPTRLSHLKQHHAPSPQSDTKIPTRKACCARRAKRLARDGVADPHGCGNPLRSGIVGLATAPDSQPSAPSHQPPALSSLLLPHHQKKRQAGFPLTCRFCNEPQLTPDKLLFVFSRVVFVFCIRFRRNLFIVVLCFRRDIFLAFRHATVD
jgi:hypothetical protein